MIKTGGGSFSFPFRPGGFLLLSDVYARGAAARLETCLVRMEKRENLFSLLNAAGFVVAAFEDFSGFLQAGWGQMILDKGLRAICAELGTDAGALKAARCGYGLIIARKGDGR